MTNAHSPEREALFEMIRLTLHSWERRQLTDARVGGQEELRLRLLGKLYEVWQTPIGGSI